MTVHDELPYSYLVEGDWTYRFGPLDAPVLVFNTVDEYGCQWVVGEPVGWGEPPAITPSDARQYGDGAYLGDTTFGQLTLSFGATETGVTVCPDRASAEAAKRRLRAVALTRVPILYTQSGDPDLSLWLRASGAPKIRWLPRSDVAFEWSFVMVAEDPFRFDAAQLAAVRSTQLPGPAAGFIYPVVYSLVYPGGSATGSIVVSNDGDESSPAAYTLTGPVTTPTVQNVTTGAAFQIMRTLTATDTVVVDTRAGTAQLNGTSIFGDLRGEFPEIIPGDNVIQWAGSAAGDVLDPAAPTAPNRAATLSVATTSTWK